MTTPYYSMVSVAVFNSWDGDTNNFYYTSLEGRECDEPTIRLAPGMYIRLIIERIGSPYQAPKLLHFNGPTEMSQGEWEAEVDRHLERLKEPRHAMFEFVGHDGRYQTKYIQVTNPDYQPKED